MPRRARRTALPPSALPRRILIIANPAAGRLRRSTRRVRQVAAALERRGCAVVVRRSLGIGDAEHEQASGGQDQVTRTLYKTVHGPVVNLGAMDPALGWTTQSVFAIRDINAYNYRTFRNWLRWNQAKSLDEFIRIQKEESALPWLHNVAAGRANAQVW